MTDLVTQIEEAIVEAQYSADIKDGETPAHRYARAVVKLLAGQNSVGSGELRVHNAPISAGNIPEDAKFVIVALNDDLSLVKKGPYDSFEDAMMACSVQNLTWGGIWPSGWGVLPEIVVSDNVTWADDNPVRITQDMPQDYRVVCAVCGAIVGQPCVNVGTTDIRAGAHNARKQAAEKVHADDGTVFVVDGSLYANDDAVTALEVPIGPFDNMDDANLYMWKMRPIWGNWEIKPLKSPQQIAEVIGRQPAAQFLTEKAQSGRHDDSQTSTEV